jgi:glycine/D-amino acid oxidase-like deaminating enzyme
MRIRSDETYWLLKNGLLTVHPSLQKSSECDVLIVGGGVTGALIAYQCCLDGYKVVMIDKRDIATGSTSATTSMLQYEIDEPLYSLKAKVGANIAVDSYLEGVKAIERLEKIIKDLKLKCGFRHKESLYMMRSEKDDNWMADEYSERRKAGLKVKMLTKTSIRNQYGAETAGGILSAVGASVDAYALTHQLLQYCIQNYGCSVYDHTELKEVVYNHNGTHAAFVGGDFKISFQSIVYATGYETLLPEKVVRLISTYAFVTEPITSLSKSFLNTLFWDTQDPYFYMRSTEDGRLLIGGGDEDFKRPDKRDRLIEKKELELVTQFYQLFPKLKIIPDFSWAGTFGVTQDSLPFIGPDPKKADTFYVLGFGGNGITFSVMGMQIISDAMAGRPNRFIEYFRFGR